MNYNEACKTFICNYIELLHDVIGDVEAKTMTSI
jgi:hypothetical protein